MDFSAEEDGSDLSSGQVGLNRTFGDYHVDENGLFTIEMENPEEMTQPELINTFFFPIIITHSITFLFGLFGNLFTVTVMLGDKNSRNATNLFLVSLAIADLLLLVLCIPLETVQYFLIQWNQNGVLCLATRYVELLSASASVLNLCAVSLERFIVIVFPMRSRSLCTLSNCRKAILMVWIVAFLLASPVIPAKTGYSMVYQNSQRNVSVTIFYCKEENEGISLALYKLVILFLAPALLMTICYFYVIRELWRSTRTINLLTNAKSFRSSKKQVTNAEKPSAIPENTEAMPERRPTPVSVEKRTMSKPSLKLRNSTQNGEKSPKLRTCSIEASPTTPSKLAAKTTRSLQQTRQHRGDDVKKARKQVIKMLILVYCAYMCCWGPKLILSFGWKLATLLKSEPKYSQEWYLVRVIFHLIPFVHSCFNPMIYSLMSKNFRYSVQQQLHRVFSKCGCKCFDCGPAMKRNAIPLRSTTRVRTLQGVESMYSNCQISDGPSARVHTTHTEVECISAI